MACTLCSYQGSGGPPGPSDHEPWCPCFMRGPVDLEGQLLLESPTEGHPMADQHNADGR
jgi:hypothetical protein